jgi:hypothetical protein
MNQALKKLLSLDSAIKLFKRPKKFDSYIFLDREFVIQIQQPFFDIKKLSYTSKKCVIISPSLYWIRKREIPGVKSLIKAQKMSSAIIEEFTDNDAYTIRVVKGKDGSYFFMAIETEQLKKKLFSHNPIDINNFEFVTAQEFFANLENPIQISESYSLANIDGSIEKIPTAYLSEVPIKKLNQYVLSRDGSYQTFAIRDKNKKYIANNYKNPIADKAITISLGVLSVAWLIEGSVSIKRAIDVSSKTEQLREEYKLPSTTFEIDNVVTKAKSVEAKQNQIRSAVKAFNNLALSEGESIDSIKISASEVGIIVKTARGDQILNILKKEIAGVSSVQNGDKIYFKAAIK